MSSRSLTKKFSQIAHGSEDDVFSLKDTAIGLNSLVKTWT